PRTGGTPVLRCAGPAGWCAGAPARRWCRRRRVRGRGRIAVRRSQTAPTASEWRFFRCGAQLTTISSPVTVTCLAGSAFGAGPPLTEPSWIEYSLPWDGHLIRPPETLPTVHPIWVQIALNALKW